MMKMHDVPLIFGGLKNTKTSQYFRIKFLCLSSDKYNLLKVV